MASGGQKGYKLALPLLATFGLPFWFCLVRAADATAPVFTPLLDS